MINREFWINKIRAAWGKKPIVWLSGVRRTGKTTLSRMIEDALYLNCDLPSTLSRLTDPEAFYGSLAANTRLILDEIHRLPDPSMVLKVAADAYPSLRILATGSSTLAATTKFRDTLTGRKTTIYLPPVLWTECPGFGVSALDKRLLHGGLPEQLLADRMDTAFFSEWIDSFYARDVQVLFGIRNRTGFLDLLHLLMRQSGGQIDYSGLSSDCGLSRPTVVAHVEAMCIAHALFLLRPFHQGGKRELTKRPKAYVFDTGFVAFARGWAEIRDDDRGILWEHLVLDNLRSAVDPAQLFYWQDKSGREVDFVLRRPGGQVDAIECKVNADKVPTENLVAFRSAYPKGDNTVVSPGIRDPYTRSVDGITIRFESLSSLCQTCGTAS